MPLINFSQDLSPDECELFSEFLLKLRMLKSLKETGYYEGDSKSLQLFNSFGKLVLPQGCTCHYPDFRYDGTYICLYCNKQLGMGQIIKIQSRLPVSLTNANYKNQIK